MEYSEQSGLDSGPALKKTGPIRKIWRGEHPLWFTLWVLGLAVGLAMLIFWSSLGRAVATPDSPLQHLVNWLGPRNWMLIAGPLAGACWLYLVIVMVGAWRSAARYQGWKVWRWLSWLVVAFCLYLLVRLLLALLTSFLFVAPATG